ncbi:ATP-binding protein [Caulobacter sp.]|uniref:ATP-binding protein n=1 Tax=Caulobacter sp. TaxID=78 RepID=UPI0031D3E2C3
MTDRGARDASGDDDRAGPGFLAGGGQMGARMRAHDWTGTPLGLAEAWPQSLKSAVSIMLNSRFPIAIYWGDALALVYNDAWAPILGEKHPWALGRAGREVWPEIWDTIGPLYAQVMSSGEGVWQEDELLPMHRHGYLEECYYNFTFSPIQGEDGRVAGIFNAVVETTERVLSERRLRTLSRMGERADAALSIDAACRWVADTLASSAVDAPFALIYRREGEVARLAAEAGLEAGAPGAPTVLPLDGEGQWPLSATGAAVVTAPPEGLVLTKAAWPEPVVQAIVLPVTLAGDPSPGAYLVAGVNPRRRLDESYRAFFDLAAGHVATAMTAARTYEEAQARAEALAQIDRAKTAFFSNVSHEFRTPLTLMLGPLEDALAPGEPLSQTQRPRIEAAHRNAQRLLRLVNTLLDFSRIEAGRARASFAPTDLATYTAELASAFGSATDKAGLALRIDAPALSRPVHVDPEMWEKIVLNLVSNAFKFTHEGEIAVGLTEVGDNAVLTVRDTGVGIEPNELPKLFDRFHRIEGVKGRSIEGSGIGLALVKELVGQHGGEISVDSRPGQGTTFTVTLPIGTQHLPAEQVVSTSSAAAAPERARAFVDEALGWLPEALGAPVQDSLVAGQAPPVPGQTPADLPAVLLADDNADLRAYISRLLEAQGYAVHAVADGHAALAAARAARPQLLVTDVMMPGLDGFGLLAAIRQDAQLRDLPVIMLSARAGEEAKVEGLDAGADDYLTKPFSARELVARVAGAIATARLRREMTQALSESESRFRNMADHAPVMMWMTNAQGACTYLNKSWYAFTGQDEAQALGEGWLDAVHPEDSPATGETFLAANARQAPFRLEYRLRRADGAYRWMIDAAAPRFGAEGEFLGYIGSVLDISDRKEAEIRVRANEAALAEQTQALQILNRAAQAVSGNLDVERLVQTVTDAGVELSGAEFGAFFYNLVNAAGESYVLYTLSGVDRSAFEGFPMPRNTAVFGPTFAGEGIVRSDDITLDPRYGRSEPHKGMPKGHLPVRSYLAVPVRSRTGEVLGGLFFAHSKPGVFGVLAEERLVGLASQAAVAMDNARLFQAAEQELGQRRQAEAALQALNATLEERVAAEIAERAKAEDALRQAQKMEAVGQLTGGVAHDFNNLLTVIIGGLDTIKRSRPSDEARVQRAADMALQGAQRAASLTERLLAFSRRQPLAPKPVDANALVRDMTELLHRTLGEQIELEGVLTPRLWPIEADQNQLESAILNLAVNARDAMPDGGKLTIETANALLDESYAAIDAEVIPGQYVSIAVSDSGAGMSRETLARVFEPFFTTKEVGKGTGLGLSMVYGFAKQSGGHVTVYSEEGQGTTVKLYFPRHFGQAAQGPEASAVIAPSSSEGEMVLVVEDNDDVRAYSVMILSELGYGVIEAANAEAAIAVLASDARLDLLFTDVVLPGKTGRSVADAAAQLRPSLKVLFTTGYSRNAIVHHGRLDPGVQLITKPFTFEQLAVRVREVIDRP